MPLVNVAMARNWAPGYFFVLDCRSDAVVLAVRGSKEIPDSVIISSTDPEPLLGGYGHREMVKSAHYLHDRLRGVLARVLGRRCPRSGAVIVDHSPEGAVASALSMFSWSDDLDREYEKNNEGPEVRIAFKTARCFAFCQPP